MVAPHERATVLTSGAAPAEDRYAEVTRILYRVLIVNLLVAVAKSRPRLRDRGGLHHLRRLPLTDRLGLERRGAGRHLGGPAPTRSQPSLRPSQVRDDGVGRHPALPDHRPGGGAEERRRAPDHRGHAAGVSGRHRPDDGHPGGQRVRRGVRAPRRTEADERGAARRRQSHAQRRADVGSRARRAARRLVGIPAARPARRAARGAVHRPRLLDDRQSGVANPVRRDRHRRKRRP